MSWSAAPGWPRDLSIIHRGAEGVTRCKQTRPIQRAAPWPHLSSPSRALARFGDAADAHVEGFQDCANRGVLAELVPQGTCSDLQKRGMMTQLSSPTTAQKRGSMEPAPDVSGGALPTSVMPSLFCCGSPRRLQLRKLELQVLPPSSPPPPTRAPLSCVSPLFTARQPASSAWSIMRLHWLHLAAQPHLGARLFRWEGVSLSRLPLMSVATVVKGLGRVIGSDRAMGKWRGSGSTRDGTDQLARGQDKTTRDTTPATWKDDIRGAVMLTVNDGAIAQERGK
ncbi:hypothetical protein CC78DRAFT_571326 [Lojkania enalia]|uniref:Uncharacterized protein n=1 Tax=Lojkania enalia TaxID=147567 RepID=A0A9P4K191_9PLEO|nr:hypothetical protein CC78DRAFT_571326 [Didymosphaeria enalia]